MKLKTFAAIATCGLATALPMTAAEPSAAPLVYELRTYYAAEGKLDALHARFRDHTIKLFEKHGMKNVGYWVPVENPDGRLIYFLAHASRDAARKSWDAFRVDPEWTRAKAASEVNGTLVSKVESVFLSPTDYSPVVRSEAASPARIFELRTYTAAEGKLNALHARFRDHTLKLFTKHGMTNVGYWSPLPDEAGAADTLIYLMAYPDRESARKSWAAFGADPDWTAAFRASQAEGSLTARGGVKGVYLTPTDYSPMK